MKYNNINFFKKDYSNKSFERPYLFLVIVPNDYERKKTIEHITKHPSLKSFTFTRFSAQTTKLSRALSTFQSLSLLDGEPFVILDDLEAYKKDETLSLVNFLKDNDANIILACAEKNSAIFNIIEKKGIVIDLSQEKPWEKEKRLAEFVLEKCMAANKSISSVNIEKLLERIGLEMSSIENEVDKLITYIGDKKSIELEDINSICSISSQSAIWKLSEEIVWGRPSFDNLSIEPSFFHTLVSAIRFQLQLGYKLASLIENGVSPSEYSNYLPRMFPKVLEKKKEIANIYGSKYFKKALEHLFEVDLLSKNNVNCYATLLDLFKAKLTLIISHE